MYSGFLWSLASPVFLQPGIKNQISIKKEVQLDPFNLLGSHNQHQEIVRSLDLVSSFAGLSSGMRSVEACLASDKSIRL